MGFHSDLVLNNRRLIAVLVVLIPLALTFLWARTGIQGSSTSAISPEKAIPTNFVLAQNSSSPQPAVAVAQQVQPVQQAAPQAPSNAQAETKAASTVPQSKLLQEVATQMSSAESAQIKPPTPVESSTGGIGAKRRVAPDFSITTIDGGTFTLSEQRGKPTILFAMAYWCGTCVPEARALEKLKQEYGDRLAILAFDVDPTSTPEALRRFMGWIGEPSFPFAMDKGNKVLRAYEIRALDTTIIINAEGEIVYRDRYPSTYEVLRK